MSAFPPRSASWNEEMEKRSRRRVPELVTRLAFQGLSENEIGRARISMMARNANVPFKGRIQKRKTYHLQIVTFGLQRAAGPYNICGAANRNVIRSPSTARLDAPARPRPSKQGLISVSTPPAEIPSPLAWPTRSLRHCSQDLAH